MPRCPESLVSLASLLLLLAGGCGKTSTQSPPTQMATRASATRPSGPVRYLALGDSYTIGESVEPDDRWPVRLAALLEQDGLQVDPPVIVGVTGFTTGDLIRRLDREPVPGQFDLVSLMIGVNNQYQGLSEDEFSHEFDELLHRSAKYAHEGMSRVIVLSIPDWGKTPFGKRAGRGHEDDDIGRPIDRFNAIAHDRCIAAGASWIDVTTATRALDGDRSLLARDELHYSRKMHEKWANLALPAARIALGVSSHNTTMPTTQP